MLQANPCPAGKRQQFSFSARFSFSAQQFGFRWHSLLWDWVFCALVRAKGEQRSAELRVELRKSPGLSGFHRAGAVVKRQGKGWVWPRAKGREESFFP